MKKIYYLLVLIVAIFSATTAKAQLLGNNERYSEYQFHVNVGLDGYYNINPGSKTYNPGVGISAKFQYDVTQNLGLTAGLGYSVVTANTSTRASTQDLKLIPFKLGAKAYFLPEWYLGGEVGVAYADPYIDARSGSHFSKVLAPSIGYESNHLDLSFRYENINHQNSYVSFIALRAAYLFNF